MLNQVLLRNACLNIGWNDGEGWQGEREAVKRWATTRGGARLGWGDSQSEHIERERERERERVARGEIKGW
jgi:hypothetical protein